MRRACVWFILLFFPFFCFGFIDVPNDGEVSFMIKSERGVSEYFILLNPLSYHVHCSVSGDYLNVEVFKFSDEYSSGLLKIMVIDSSGRTGVFETVLVSHSLKKPAIKSLKTSSDGIHLSWSSAGPGCICYDLYRDGVLIKSNLRETQYYDREADVLNSHCYRVNAVFSSGESSSEEKCSTGLSSITEKKAFPNPAKDKVVFTGLDRDWELVILNVSGDVVFSVKADDKAYIWYLLNSSGNKVSSGIYYYLMKSPSGSVEKTGKLAIVK
ncbi:MAG TPA: hypothetical protein ENN73_04645 [Firmicutes bacterium]|nr:hypothetical protein [Bacillota bacterium]